MRRVRVRRGTGRVMSAMSCEARRLVLLAHTIDVRPEAFLKPADMLEELLAPHHLLLAIGRRGCVGQLVDQAAARVYKFGERSGRPVGNKLLVQRYNVRLVGRGGERGREG